MRTLWMGVALLSLAACASGPATDEPVAAVNVGDNGAVEVVTPALPRSGGATAALRTADGRDVGTVTASVARDGLTLTVDARMMPAGVHGIHIHTTGLCEGPKFTSAGGHWNPTGRMHGKDNPMGPHEGDLPNLTVDGGGTGTVSFTIRGASLSGPTGLLDGDGAAFVVHAGPDDYKTDPSGNSGDRIACGVFAAR